MKENMKKLFRSKGLLAAALFATASVQGAEVEVLHYWTSGGEAKSVQELKKLVEKQGVGWKDFSVEGDSNSRAALVARIKAGNAVTAAQTKTPGIQQFGRDGSLATLDSVAAKGNWDRILPPAVANSQKYNGKYVAVPVNVHRENWLWVNTEVFARAGAKIPTTFDEFFEAAEKIKRVGIIPIARGGEGWQDTMILESVVLGVGGPDFYHKVYIDLDEATLTGPTMLKAFQTMARIRSYTDKYADGRSWQLATSMVIHGKAGMQFMGDWAKGDFLNKGKVPGKDFACVAAPDTAADFIYSVDSLVMFDVKNEARREAQLILADTVMGPEFQEVFNLNKGSIPVRSGVSRDKFDPCATKSMDDMAASSNRKTLVPGNAMSMTDESVAIFQSVTHQFMNTTMAPQQAVDELAKKLHDLGSSKKLAVK